MARIVVVGRHRGATLTADLQRLNTLLHEHGHDVVWETDTADALNVPGSPTVRLNAALVGVDVVLSYGGDGTALTAARWAAPHGVPVLAVHKGRVGFLADFSHDRFDVIQASLMNPLYEDRWMVRAIVERDGRLVFDGLALNDAVVRGDAAALIEFDLILNGRLACTERADGFVVCTPSGSTAYNLAAGGPILLPALPVMALTPICPQRLSNRPVVVDTGCQVQLRLYNDGSTLTLDGLPCLPLQANDRIHVQAADVQVRFVVPPQHDRFSVLQVKLGWNA